MRMAAGFEECVFLEKAVEVQGTVSEALGVTKCPFFCTVWLKVANKGQEGDTAVREEYQGHLWKNMWDGRYWLLPSVAALR